MFAYTRFEEISSLCEIFNPYVLILIYSNVEMIDVWSNPMWFYLHVFWAFRTRLEVHSYDANNDDLFHESVWNKISCLREAFMEMNVVELMTSW